MNRFVITRAALFGRMTTAEVQLAAHVSCAEHAVSLATFGLRDAARDKGADARLALAAYMTLTARRAR